MKKEHVEEKAGGIRSVEKALAILQSFRHDEPELGVMELSRRLGLHKSSVSRLLSTLEAGGLVERNPETGRYYLGVELIALAGLVVRHADLRIKARYHLEKLAEACDETVNLSVWVHGMAMNVEQFVPANRQIKDIGWVGRRTPPNATSVGKILLAYLPSVELSQVLNEIRLQPLTAHTITDRSRLQSELEEVKRRGVAFGLEELEIGLHSVAAPVRDHSSTVVAAVSISGPAYRVTIDRLPLLEDMVRSAAEDISHALGWDPGRVDLARVNETALRHEFPWNAPAKIDSANSPEKVFEYHTEKRKGEL